jgi:DNA-3-methyladenine glycosylase I
MTRCNWVNQNPKMITYHDQEWGVPVFDDQKIFEFLCLESAQAGLSWETVLNKREGYKKAFDNFDYKKIAEYNQKKVAELLLNPEIIRNKLKVNAAVTNAQKFIEVQKEFGSFSKYIWSFVDNKPIQNNLKTQSDIQATSEISDKLSKDLIKRGFKFVGSTIIYAHMQATGMINDHLVSCFRYKEVKKCYSTHV